MVLGAPASEGDVFRMGCSPFVPEYEGRVASFSNHGKERKELKRTLEFAAQVDLVSEINRNRRYECRPSAAAPGSAMADEELLQLSRRSTGRLPRYRDYRDWASKSASAEPPTVVSRANGKENGSISYISKACMERICVRHLSEIA